MAETPEKARRWSVGLAYLGASMQGVMFVVIVQIGWAMTRAFRELQESDAVDPSRLAFAVQDSMMVAVFGWVLSCAGWIVILIALWPGGYRARWVFWFTLTAGGLLSLILPMVLIATVWPIGYCLHHRATFLRSGISQG